jgi:RNA polymerase sigma factor (sigma-70 family)
MTTSPVLPPPLRRPDYVAPGRPDFDGWYPDAWRRLVAAMIALTGDQAVAEDLASQAIARAYERWERIQDPSPWTYRVAVNLARRRWRRLGRERALPSPPGRTAHIPEVVPELWRAVAALPLRQRTAIVLRYVLDLRQEEIAEVMGIRPGTVAATLHAARARLRIELGGTDEEKTDGRR